MSGIGAEKNLFDRARYIYNFYCSDGGLLPSMSRGGDDGDARVRLFRRSLLMAMNDMSASERDEIRRSWEGMDFKNKAQFIEYCRGFDPSLSFFFPSDIRC